MTGNFVSKEAFEGRVEKAKKRKQNHPVSICKFLTKITAKVKFTL